MDLGLKDKIAFVAAASRGLGAATAWQLAREGAHVAINGRDPARLQTTAEAIQRETGAQVLVAPGDVNNAAEVEKMIGETAQHFGGLDILVTNSGGPPAGRFDNFDDEAWLSAVNLLLLGTVRLIRAALPHLRQSKAAAVLAVTSISVKQPVADLLLSNSIRLSVIGLIKSLALEPGNDSIRFNSILPASIETDRIMDLLTRRAQQTGATLDEELKKMAATSSFGRLGTPQEFGNVAAFLCSPAAAYLTGVMLPIDGGMYKGMI